MFIEKTSEKIVEYLVDSKTVDDTTEIRGFYQYGIEITISSLLNIVLLLIIGLVCGHILDTIIYLPLFILLRRFTGGYHANTYFKCNLIGCITFICVLIIRDIILRVAMNKTLILIVGVVSIIVILVCCPIENKNKPIPNEKKTKYKLFATFISAIYLGLGSWLLILSSKYGLMVLCTLLTVTVFVIIKNNEKRNCNEKEQFKSSGND